MNGSRLNIIRRAAANGAARYRDCGGGAFLFHVADMETSVMLRFEGGGCPFDLSRCRRLTRSGARRVVRSMHGATNETRARYLALIDARRDGTDANESEGVRHG